MRIQMLLSSGQRKVAALLLGVLFSSSFKAQDLQTQIKVAKPGDTIVVKSGLCVGNIVVDKKLFLIGEDKPVIRGNGAGSVVTILADSCMIQGFVVEHSGRMLVDEDAGILIKSMHNVVESNELRDILFGIYLFSASKNVIARNTIVGRKFLELAERGSGIHLWNSDDNVLQDNVITDVRDGFYIQYASRTHIEGNNVFGVRYGLHYMYADSNIFLRNRFVDNVAGAAVMYSRGIRIRHNVFLRNRGFASYGILFQDCNGMVVDSNIVADNNTGLFFEATRDNIFRHNIIARNDAALQMFQNSTGNVFTENNFIDNLSPLLVIGKRTESLWDFDGRGNYWSEYDGYDLDQNGVGDIPMKIQNVFQYLEGRSPNLRLYLYSPASQALAASARAFPVMDFTNETDGHPLVHPVLLAGSPAMQLAESHRHGMDGHSEYAAWIFLIPGVSCTVGIAGLYVAKRKRR